MTRSFTRRSLTVLATSAAALLLAACSSSSGASSTPTGTGSASPPPNFEMAVVKVADSPLGPILVGPSGQPLYMFTLDHPGTSNCVTACLKAWPIFGATSAQYAAGQGVTAKITLLKRPDGMTQLAANGWPLYMYANHETAGDLSGQGVKAFGGSWYALSPTGKPITASAPTSSGTASSTPGMSGY
jgi:predicted lipoprotein with Yx(FWY)xxD motif